MPRETWTKEELDYLRANHATMTRKELAAGIGHTHSESAVRGKIKQLGLASKLSASERLSRQNDLGDGNPGAEYGQLIVIGPKRKTYRGNQSLYEVPCRCSCGKELYVLLTNLRRGRSKSCGCKPAKLAGDRKRTHGMSKTRLYRTWAGMKKRCMNPNDESYQDYGARGIHVCEAWLTFEPFRDWALSSGYADELEIERKDYDGHYCPENCCWATFAEQANNRRNNRRLTVWGETKTMAQWSRDDRCVVSYDVLNERLVKLGWEPEIAITTPLQEQNSRHPYAVKAREAVHTALKGGRLIRAGCSWPGCNETKVEAHHYLGYEPEHWLSVIWLCRRHHGEIERTRSDDIPELKPAAILPRGEKVTHQHDDECHRNSSETYKP